MRRPLIGRWPFAGVWLFAGQRLLHGLAAACTLAVPSSLAAQDVDALTPFQIERTERFLAKRVACLGCHRISGAGGAIGPTLEGIADRVEYDYVVSMIRDPRATIPGTLMPQQPMPDREADRLARYLMTRVESAGDQPPAPIPQPPAALGPGQESDGSALYARHCAACHGESGQGDGWNAGNLPVAPTAHDDPELMSRRADDTLYDAISAGGYVLDRSPLMPAFGRMLEPDQIRALVGHIRTLCACEQPAWARGSP